MITCRVYRDGKLSDEGFDPERVSDFLEAPDTLVWLDVVNPTEDDIRMCREEFDLHPESLADVRERGQRTKVDQYRTYFQIVAYAVEGTLTDLIEKEIHIYAGTRYLLTFRFDPLFDITQVVHRWDLEPELTKFGGGALLYVLLDEIIDSYYPVIEGFDDQIDAVEERIFATRVEEGLQLTLFRMKRELVNFRKHVLPLRDVLDFLTEDVGVVTPDLRPYFNDVYDNVFRAIEFVDGARETLTSALGAYQAAVGNQMNFIMKKLSAWAAILLVPTLIAGVYGMNFEHMPEIPTRYGYPVVLTAMFLICFTMYRTFKKRGWL